MADDDVTVHLTRNELNRLSAILRNAINAKLAKADKHPGTIFGDRLTVAAEVDYQLRQKLIAAKVVSSGAMQQGDGGVPG